MNFHSIKKVWYIFSERNSLRHRKKRLICETKTTIITSFFLRKNMQNLKKKTLEQLVKKKLCLLGGNRYRLLL